MVDLDEKLAEFRRILAKYDGVIPAQNVDRIAYAAITYCLKKYGDSPQMQQLIAEFPNIRANKRDTFEDKLAKVSSYLQEYGKVPSISDDQSKYCFIRNFFQKYQDHEDVKRLRYVYAYGTNYPLENSKCGPRPVDNYDPWSGCVTPEYITWKKDVAYEYVLFVFEQYGILPAPNTRPIEEITTEISYFYRYNVDFKKSQKEPLVEFIDKMVSSGCKEPLITYAYNVIHLDIELFKQRVYSLVLQNGACAIHYIAQCAMPDHPLPDEFVYYYYYVLFNDRTDGNGIMPLGSLYSQMEPYRTLRVHFLDYEKLDVDSLRQSAIDHYRDWEEYPPQTIEEWKYYGQSELFFNHEDFEPIRNNETKDNDWSKTFIEKRLEKGCAYFRFLHGSHIYLDYRDYLFNKGITDIDRDLVKMIDRSEKY